MPVFTMICMANSTKLGGRCVAGLRVDGGGWIRPVSNDESSKGALSPRHYKLEDGAEVRPLDVVEISVIRPFPQPHQPENWLIEDKPWQLIQRKPGPEILNILHAQIFRGSALLGNRSDRISFDTFVTTPAQTSLVLVEPENLYWHITSDIKNRPQVRAVFQLSGQGYDLVVTDPLWNGQLKVLPFGCYPGLDVPGLKSGDKILFTISLGEPFEKDNCCYKLVAGVISLPRRWRNRF